MNKYHVVSVSTTATGTTIEYRIAGVENDILVVDRRFPPGKDKDAYLLVTDALNREDRRLKRKAKRQISTASVISTVAYRPVGVREYKHGDNWHENVSNLTLSVEDAEKSPYETRRSHAVPLKAHFKRLLRDLADGVAEDTPKNRTLMEDLSRRVSALFQMNQEERDASQ